MRTRILVAILLVVLLAGGLVLYQHRYTVAQMILSLTVPEAMDFEEVIVEQDQPINEEQSSVEVVVAPKTDQEEPPQNVELLTATIPDQINLAIPFLLQAPTSNWALPYQEACEEASVLMAAAFLGEDVNLSTPQTKAQEILDLVDFEMEYLGFYLDTNVADTISFANSRYPALVFASVANPTVDQIKAFVAQGSPVIVPAAGRELHNPFFSREGPLYHMVVIRGYTTSSFITNDPGVGCGAEYVYSYETIMEAMGDWNDGNPTQGEKVVIVVRKRL